MSDDLDQDHEASGLRAKLDEESRARIEAQNELAELKRREVFRDAGLDPSKKLHQAVIRGYDGEVTAEAVKSYVSDLDIAAPSEAPAPPPTAPDDQAALVRIAEAAMGDGRPPPSPDRREELRKEIDAAAKRGARKNEMDALLIQYSQAGGYQTAWDNPS